MDPETALVLFGSAGLAVKVLGPTADYLGDGMKEWSVKRVENVKRIFDKADAKLRSGVDSNIAVPPRVLAGVLNDGSYTDDDIAAEYFGGVLASSRSGITRDDRGSYWNGIIGGLSTYQLRAHYVLYAAAQSAMVGRELNIAHQATAEGVAGLLMPWEVLIAGLAFTAEEAPQFDAVVSHALWGMYQSGLIYRFQFGGAEQMKTQFGVDQAGLQYVPSALGAELFLWAHGEGDQSTHRFSAAGASFEPIEGVEVLPGTRLVSEIKAEIERRADTQPDGSRRP